MINTMTLTALREGFGAVIEGMDLRSATAEDAARIRELLYENKVLVIRNQSMNEAEYVEFARKMGEPVRFVDPNYQHPDHPDIFVVTNMKSKGKKIGMDRVGYYWHSDSSFMPKPLPITMLYSQHVPDEGGETSFIDMAEVHERLPQSMKIAMTDLKARHESKWRYIITPQDEGLSVQEVLDRDEAQCPSSSHPVIITHPHTGLRSLYVSEGFTKAIEGIPYETSAILLKDFFSKTRSSPTTYVHRWSPREVVLWDNRSVVHRAHPPAEGQGRMMFRIGVDDGPFYKAES